MPSRPLAFRHGPLTAFVHPLKTLPDLPALAAMLPSHHPVVWLDSARTHPVTGRWSLLAWDPWLTVRADGARCEVRTSAATEIRQEPPFACLRRVLARYQAPPRGVALEQALGLLGWISYDANRWIERLPDPVPGGGVPELLWFAMRVSVLVDHTEGRAWLVSVVDPHLPAAVARREARDAADRALAWLDCPALPRLALRVPAARLEPAMSRGAYEAMVERALARIRAGEIYQANLAQRFTAQMEGEPLALYLALRRINPSPFACFIRAGGLAVVSCSPERLVRVQEGRVDTRPIAGTRPRGASASEDAIQSLELLLNEKERAEHIMLVDLARNDLGRVCASGSVAVDELMALEPYSHVMHIVSNVSGRLSRGSGAVEVIRAVFPGGTITGCPKVRCMQVIRELEPVARGLYTGSIGWLAFSGGLDLNIAIRTILVQESRASFHVGAGIVADSRPDREYEETLAKGRAMAAALGAAAFTEADDAVAR